MNNIQHLKTDCFHHIFLRQHYILSHLGLKAASRKKTNNGNFFSFSSEKYKYILIQRKPECAIRGTDIRGSKIPPRGVVLCVRGTPVQAILDKANLTGLAGVREGQNMGQNGPRLYKSDANLFASEPSGGPQMGQAPLKWTPNGPPLINLSPFPGSSNHLGTSRGLGSQKFSFYLYFSEGK